MARLEPARRGDRHRGDRKSAPGSRRAAAGGGPTRLVLCATTGGTLPGFVVEATRAAAALGKPLGIHCHNDCELAVANSLGAVEAGAVQVQGTINGFGERCGNANLISIIAGLELKLGYQTLGAESLQQLTEL